MCLNIAPLGYNNTYKNLSLIVFLSFLTEKIQKDNQVRIAFLITINGRASRQVRRLIKQLYNGRNYFYIHVDSRQDYLYREMKGLELKFPENIYVTPNRSTTIWGGSSFLSMITGCFKDLLRMPWEWDFVINLSESDYPLKKIEDFVAFVTSNRDKNFVLFLRGVENSQKRSAYVKTQGNFIKNKGLDIINSEIYNFKPRIMYKNNSMVFFVFQV